MDGHRQSGVISSLSGVLRRVRSATGPPVKSTILRGLGSLRLRGQSPRSMKCHGKKGVRELRETAASGITESNRKTKLACLVEAHESTRKRLESTLPPFRNNADHDAHSDFPFTATIRRKNGVLRMICWTSALRLWVVGLVCSTVAFSCAFDFSVQGSRARKTRASIQRQLFGCRAAAFVSQMVHFLKAAARGHRQHSS